MVLYSRWRAGIESRFDTDRDKRYSQYLGRVLVDRRSDSVTFHYDARDADRNSAGTMTVCGIQLGCLKKAVTSVHSYDATAIRLSSSLSVVVKRIINTDV